MSMTYPKLVQDILGGVVLDINSSAVYIHSHISLWLRRWEAHVWVLEELFVWVAMLA